MVTIIGHEDIRRELRVLAASGDVPHALLFVGPEGTGRTLLALEYAQLLNCERAPRNAPASASLFGDDPAGPVVPATLPCGECRNCRLIRDGGHPDVIALGPGDTLCKPRAGESAHPRHPDSRDIRICQIRGLIELVARYPFEANYRLILIDPADRIGREASHTILKTLEEPPGHTIFALVTSAPGAIIETIRSRCRRIDVRPVPRDEIQRGLREMEYAPEIAMRAGVESRGRPGRAIAFAEKPDLMDDRDRLLERCATVAAGRTPERFRHAEALAERYRRDRSSVANELDAWESFWEERLHQLSFNGDGLGARQEALGTIVALRAVARVREDLLGNVIARAAFELMLLSFPALTPQTPLSTARERGESA